MAQIPTFAHDELYPVLQIFPCNDQSSEGEMQWWDCERQVHTTHVLVPREYKLHTFLYWFGDTIDG